MGVSVKVMSGLKLGGHVFPSICVTPSAGENDHPRRMVKLFYERQCNPETGRRKVRWARDKSEEHRVSSL